MAASIKSLRGAVQFGIVNGKRNMIVELGTLVDLFQLNDELLTALKAVVSIADRNTVEFDAARAAIAKAEGA